MCHSKAAVNKRNRDNNYHHGLQYLYIKISININLFSRAVITGPRLAALGFALLLRHLFRDRINLSLGVNVFVSERAPGLMMQLLRAAAQLPPATQKWRRNEHCVERSG